MMVWPPSASGWLSVWPSYDACSHPGGALDLSPTPLMSLKVAQGSPPWQLGCSIHMSEHAAPLLQATVPAVVEAAALAAMQAQRAQGRAIALADELAAQVAAKPGKGLGSKGKARDAGSSQLGAAGSPIPQPQGDMPTAPAAEEGGLHGPAGVHSSEGQADPSGQQGSAAVLHSCTSVAQSSHSGKKHMFAGARARTLRLLQPAKATTQVLLSGR